MPSPWLTLPKRGYADLKDMVLTGVLSITTQQGASILTDIRTRNFPHLSRSLKALRNKGILVDTPDRGGFEWTGIGRAIAISMRRAQQTHYRPTPSSPLPLDGIALWDLLEWMPPSIRVDLCNMPKKFELARPYWAAVMDDLGVVAVHRGSDICSRRITDEQMLDFFKRNPRFIPNRYELSLPPLRMNVFEVQRYEIFQAHLHRMRREYEAAGTTDADWDII